MDKPNDKWIGLLKEKLNSYTPPYNSAGWEHLSKQIPATPGGHGWLLSKIATVKTVVITTVAVVSTVVGVYIFKPQRHETERTEKENILKDSVINQQKDELVEEVKTGKESLDVSKSLNDLYYEKDTKVNEKSSANTKSDELRNVSETQETEKQDKVQKDDDAGHLVTDNAAAGVVAGQAVVTRDKEVSEDIETGVAVYDQSSSAMKQGKRQFNREGTNQPITVLKTGGVSTENINNLSFKLKGKSLKIDNYKKPKTRKLHNSRRHATFQGTVPASSQKLKITKPLYLGISYTGKYSDGNPWQKHKYVNLIGFTAEQYIFKNFSVSLNPRFSFNSIYKNLEYDVTNPGPVDSLGIQHYETIKVDSSDVYPGKISYIEFPLFVNCDFYSGNKSKLSVLLGISGRYTFSLASDELSEELKPFNNKFSLFQTGIVSLRYRRQLSDRFFMTVEPFAEFPLNKEPEIFNHTQWGINIHFDVEFRKRRKRITP